MQSLKFEHEAQQVAFADCVSEVLHMGDRLARLDKDIDRLVLSAPPHMRAVIEALQALRGVAKLTAVTIMTEVGTFKRLRRPTEMMGYTGFVPSEYSSGGRESKGRCTRGRQRSSSARPRRGSLAFSPSAVAESSNEEAAAIAAGWGSRHRLEGPRATAPQIHQMIYCRKPDGKVAAAVAREMVGFVWAIWTLVESRQPTKK